MHLLNNMFGRRLLIYRSTTIRIVSGLLERLAAPEAGRPLNWIADRIGKMGRIQDDWKEPSIRAAWEEHCRGNSIEALAKWEIVRKKWPKRAIGYCGVAACARGSGQLSYASEVIEDALEQFPNDPSVIAEAASIADLRGDWATSAALWEKTINAPDAQLAWRHSYVHALLMVGQYDKAALLLQDLRRRFPDYGGFLALQAMLAGARMNLEQSLAIWSEYRKLFPEDPVGWEHYGRTHQAREFERADEVLRGRVPQESHAESHAAVPIAPLNVEVVDDEDARALLMTFESIGSDCEFGLVQRRFGAEPLGLLRFNSVSFGGLLAALAHRLDSMGDPDNTEMMTLPNGEYFIRDRRWDISMHTFIFQGQQERDALYAKLCRRVAFLKDKLLSDFAEAKKVFVFTSPALTRDELSTLHRSLKSLGSVALLHVKPVSATADGIVSGEAGSVTTLDRDLFVGFLSRPGLPPNGFWDIAFDDWIAVCRKVRNIVETSWFHDS
jgi:tetratricopeptide (TPR) repeat protein